MRTIPLNRLLARLQPALFTASIAAGFMLFLLCPANAAPVEVDIPQSPPVRHVKARPQPSQQMPEETAPGHVKVRPQPPPQAPEEISPASSAPSDEAASQPPPSAAEATATVTPSTVHKFFPYTIRTGDTLETIANIFGVQVADLTRANRHLVEGDLRAGDTIRVPNPFVTREAELNAEVERLSIDKEAAERKADQATNALASSRSLFETAAASNTHYQHDLHLLPVWRTVAWTSSIAGVVMFGMMLAALIEWWNLRARYRAVAEMNDSLRRLDYRYRIAMAKAELRLQQLYGRRRRGLEDGQERVKIPEETEIEQLDLQIKEILESYLEKLGPPNNRSSRARLGELIGAVGAPIEARTARR